MSDAEGLNRTLAGLLSELEDEEVRLANRQSELSKELQGVEGELERIAAVKRAIHGGGAPPARKRTGQNYPSERRKRSEEFVKALDNGATFGGRELAEYLGTDGRGVGPLVAGLERRGVIVRVEGETSPTGHRVYRRA